MYDTPTESIMQVKACICVIEKIYLHQNRTITPHSYTKALFLLVPAAAVIVSNAEGTGMDTGGCYHATELASNIRAGVLLQPRNECVDGECLREASTRVRS
jgi:hypothetical protein